MALQPADFKSAASTLPPPGRGSETFWLWLEWTLEARSGIEPLYTALQAAASPLCHLAGGAQFSIPPPRHGSERVLARQFAPDDEPVDRLRTLVGADALQVQHVSQRSVVERDTGGAENVAAVSRDIERRSDVVPLRQ